MKAGDYPWCVCETNKNTVTFKCERCNQEHKFNNAGMSISRFLDISNAFCIIHKECKDKLD